MKFLKFLPLHRRMFEDNRSTLIETSSCNHQFFSELFTTRKRICMWCHCKRSLLIRFTMQSYKSYYMVSPQTVFTYPFHHAKLQILLHGVTANSLYLSFSPCKATNLTTWCHRKQSLLILFTMQSYKSYYMVSPQTVLYLSFSPCKATNLTTWCHRKQSFTYPFHHAKLQELLAVYSVLFKCLWGENKFTGDSGRI